MTQKIVTRVLNKGDKSHAVVHGVFRGVHLIGMIERYKSRSTIHPWKAYSGAEPGGEGHTTFLGSFYPQDGGKDAAIQAVQTHYDAIAQGVDSPYACKGKVVHGPGQLGGLG